MSEHRGHSHSTGELPKAKIERNWKTWLIWLVPIAAALLAGWFVHDNVIRGGPKLHIYFESADGIQPGKSQIMYRGARIGEVRDVSLTKDHRWVDVSVALDSFAASVAREGSRFWIVKPQVGAEQIRDLRTIVSGNYITVEPGEGRKQTKFTGLSSPPVIEPSGALRIVLLAEKAGSLQARSAVFYRGLQIGEVFSTELGPVSQTVHITVYIRKEYAPLVRLNSRFWNAGGIHASLSLSGINIAAQSTEALLSGGISLATPDTNDKIAPPGTSFRLYDKPDDAWLAWAPAIPLNHQNGTINSSPNVSQ